MRHLVFLKLWSTKIYITHAVLHLIEFYMVELFNTNFSFSPFIYSLKILIASLFSLNILLLFNFKRSLSFFLGSFGKYRWPSFYSASDTTTWRFFKDQLLYFYSNFKRQLFQMNQKHEYFRHRNTCHVLINESVKFQSEFWFILIILIRTIYFPSLLTAAFCCVWSFFFSFYIW